MDQLLNVRQKIEFKKYYQVFAENSFFCTKILTTSFDQSKILVEITSIFFFQLKHLGITGSLF